MTTSGGAAITGAAGFLGAHLVRALRSRGQDVLPLVRAPDARMPPGGRALGEILDRPALLDGVDVMIHAAAVRHRYGASEADYRASNVDLVARLLEACSAAGVRRFVFVSSVGVYGFPARLPIDEGAPYAPRTLYSETKVEAEVEARRWADRRVELVIARPTIFYGSGDRNGMLDKMAAMMRAGTYRLVGAGDNVLHHAHVDDIVEGIGLAATVANAAGEDFILAGPETTTLAALSALVARAVGRALPRQRVPLRLARAVATGVDVAAKLHLAFTTREPPINHGKLDVMTLPVAFDIAKARRVLGFSPKIGYEAGVARPFRLGPAFDPTAGGEGQGRS